MVTKLSEATPINYTNNIPVALLILHSSLNVILTFGTICLSTRRHFQVLFGRQTGWILSSLELFADNVMFTIHIV